jgi:hypothetical protein
MHHWRLQNVSLQAGTEPRLGAPLPVDVSSQWPSDEQLWDSALSLLGRGGISEEAVDPVDETEVESTVTKSRTSINVRGRGSYP